MHSLPFASSDTHTHPNCIHHIEQIVSWRVTETAPAYHGKIIIHSSAPAPGVSSLILVITAPKTTRVPIFSTGKPLQEESPCSLTSSSPKEHRWGYISKDPSPLPPSNHSYFLLVPPFERKSLMFLQRSCGWATTLPVHFFLFFGAKPEML